MTSCHLQENLSSGEFDNIRHFCRSVRYDGVKTKTEYVDESGDSEVSMGKEVCSAVFCLLAHTMLSDTSSVLSLFMHPPLTPPFSISHSPYKFKNCFYAGKKHYFSRQNEAITDSRP